MITLPQFLRTILIPSVRQPAAEGIDKLASILQMAPEQLEQIGLGALYHYRPFTVPKADGRPRSILAPSPALKELQRRLLHRHLSHLPVHPAATAFMPGGSVIVNARQHLRQAVIATADIEDFFFSTTADRVRQWFVRGGWRGKALSILMHLCVYRGGLPQGAPTSPCLSNLVNRELDEALCALARRSGATYTRYGDDLSFSWPSERLPARFQEQVRKHLLEAGYRLQPRKGWRVWHIQDRPQVTGIVLGGDGRLYPPDGILNEINRLRWRADRAARDRLQGYEGYLCGLDAE